MATDPSKNTNAKNIANRLSEQQQQGEKTTDTRASQVPPAPMYTGLSGKTTEGRKTPGG